MVSIDSTHRHIGHPLWPLSKGANLTCRFTTYPRCSVTCSLIDASWTALISSAKNPPRPLAHRPDDLLLRPSVWLSSHCSASQAINSRRVPRGGTSSLSPSGLASTSDLLTSLGLRLFGGVLASFLSPLASFDT